MELSDSECRAVEDVVVLAELTEEIILRVLQIRYEDLNIYTNAGNVLMAINPFSQVPLYTDTILNTYRKAYLSKLELLPPHPWKTAAKAYIQMFGDNRQTCSLLKPTTGLMRHQSVVVSGESGAGKTETTKIIMAFLAKVSSLNRKRDSLGTIQCKVLEANTILDAVGNARTMRNDNSSRFGKYVKLHFDPAGELVGAGLDTFLLETTRVVRRNQDEERNFHIFYLICAEADPKQRELLKLHPPETYTYLNSSGIYDRRDGIKDSDMLELFKSSMNVLSIEPEDMQGLLKCFVAILTVGNIRFESHTTTAGTVEITVVESTQQYLSDAAELLDISPQDLLESFTTRTMCVASEQLSMTLTSTQAEEVRDIFAKTLYSVVFAWLIEFLNLQLAADDLDFEIYSLSSIDGPPKTRRRERALSTSVKAGIDEFGARKRTGSENSSAAGLSDPPGMIGILDIFGFEKQTHNGLEQLLINYANETLQKQYDEVMIDAEQAFYASESIAWDFIQFPSNKDCIDLIANKRASVLTLLDEACLAPSGSDSSFIRQVYNALGKHTRLHLTSRIQANNEFGIKHYAGTVIYSVSDFVTKNKNEIFPLTLLKASTNDFVLRIGQSTDIETKKSMPGNRREALTSRNSKKFLTATISNSFKKSVSQLIATLEETQAHYVKCIKPNSLNVKNQFVVALVSEQLRCNGIMQTIVVTRCGYPIRFTYEQFHERYNSLMRTLLVGKPYSIASGVEAVINRLHVAFSTGEIIIKENVTTLDSISGLQKTIKKSDSAENLQNVNEMPMPGWGIQRGETRVFLRYHEYAALDTMHDIMVGVLATNIQRIFRGYKYAQAFRAQKRAAVKIARAYLLFYRNVRLMTAVLIMQDFMRNVVLEYIARKKHARLIIEKIFYRFHCQNMEIALLRKYHASKAIQAWWRHIPWVQEAPRRAFLRAVFAPVIIRLQQAIRFKLVSMRKAKSIVKQKSATKDKIIKKPQSFNTSSQKTSDNIAKSLTPRNATPKNITPRNVTPKRDMTPKMDVTPKRDMTPKKDVTPKRNMTPKRDHTPKRDMTPKRNSNGNLAMELSFQSDSTPPKPPISSRDLLKANSHILWPIFIYYSKEKASIPGNTVPLVKRNATRLVAATGMLSLLKDWSLIPALSSQYKAHNLLKEEMAKDNSPSKLFAFTHFLSFISKLATSFHKDNDIHELTDKIKLLDAQYQWTEEVIVVKHLLTIMNTSDGRAKFSQARNASLIPSFVGVDGSEDALLLYLEAQANKMNTSQLAQHNQGSHGKRNAVTPTFREVGMCDAVYQLMRKNESTLISLALRYCPSSSSLKVGAGSTPGIASHNSSSGKKDIGRKGQVVMSMDAVYNCLHDFEVCPILCSKSVLRALFSMVEARGSSLKSGNSPPLPPTHGDNSGNGTGSSTGSSNGSGHSNSNGPGSGLSFTLFTELLDHVAQNCLFGVKYSTPEGRVRAMFHHMNSSRGRSKLNRDPNSLIITPLTGLEMMDPKLESNSSHRKNVESKVYSTPERGNRDEKSPSPSRARLPMSHYQHLRTIRTPPRSVPPPESSKYCDDRPEWNFR